MQILLESMQAVANVRVSSMRKLFVRHRLQRTCASLVEHSPVSLNVSYLPLRVHESCRVDSTTISVNRSMIMLLPGSHALEMKPMRPITGNDTTIFPGEHVLADEYLPGRKTRLPKPNTQKGIVMCGIWMGRQRSDETAGGNKRGNSSAAGASRCDSVYINGPFYIFMGGSNLIRVHTPTSLHRSSVALRFAIAALHRSTSTVPTVR